MARIVELEALQARLQAEGQQLREELAAATLAMHEAQGTLGTQVLMLHQALELAEHRGDLLNATEARLAAVHAIADEQRATIAGLEVRRNRQDLRLRAALAQATKLAEACAAAEAAMEEAIGERNIARANGHLAAAQERASDKRRRSDGRSHAAANRVGTGAAGQLPGRKRSCSGRPRPSTGSPSAPWRRTTN